MSGLNNKNKQYQKNIANILFVKSIASFIYITYVIIYLLYREKKREGLEQINFREFLKTELKIKFISQKISTSKLLSLLPLN